MRHTEGGFQITQSHGKHHRGRDYLHFVSTVPKECETPQEKQIHMCRITVKTWDVFDEWQLER